MTEQRPATQTADKLDRIGRYRIVRPLSKGGMALVYEARRESLAGVSPRVAIKLIIPDYASSDQFQELFINEARLGAQLHHQNLVQIQDFDRDGDKFFLVMEYVEGLTLRRIVTQCARNGIEMPLDVLCEIGRQVCDGLHYAHAALDDKGRHLGLVHRDIKPSNLILNPQGAVKILDFGISKGRLIREKKGAVKGTWGYMAPEQARGDEVGPAADIFGVATVLYELATKRPLFDQKSPDDIKRLLNDDHAVRMASTIDPAYGGLVNVLMRALQRDANARYETAGDFGRALSELMVNPITARDQLLSFAKYIEDLDQGRVPTGKAPTSSALSDMSRNTGSAVGSQASLAASQVSVVQEGGLTSVLGAIAVAVFLVLGVVAALSVTVLGIAWVSQPIDEPVVSLAGSGDDIATPEAAPEAKTPAVAAVESDADSRPPPNATVGQPSITAKSETAKVVAPKIPEEATIIVRRKTEPEPAEIKNPIVAPEVVKVEAPVAVGVGRMTISAVPGKFEVYVDGRLANKGALVRAEFPAGSHLVTLTLEDGRSKTFDVNLEADQDVKKIWDFTSMEWRR